MTERLAFAVVLPLWAVSFLGWLAFVIPGLIWGRK